MSVARSWLGSELLGIRELAALEKRDAPEFLGGSVVHNERNDDT